MDASNILKPALAGGNLRCIGSTTYSEYKAAFERDRALARRFQKIEISEPTIEETYEILKGLKRFYEEHHGVKYSDESLKTAAELAGKYINDRYLAGQGDRRDRRSRRGGKTFAGKPPSEKSLGADGRKHHRANGEDPAKDRRRR